MWCWWMWTIKPRAPTRAEQHGEPWENASAPGKCQRGLGVKRGWWRGRKERTQWDPRCGKGDWGAKWEDWEDKSLRQLCNEICSDGAMIQLSSRGFKRVLDGLHWIIRLLFECGVITSKRYCIRMFLIINLQLRGKCFNCVIKSLWLFII